MDLQLKDKVALITGASGGIGRALAESFASEGAQLALTGSKHIDELDRWLGDQPWRERAIPIAADVTSARQMSAAFERACDRFGRVDVCIANAGVWTPEFKLLHQADEERIKKTIEIDLLGAMWTARGFLQSLARVGPRADEHGAALVFIGSTAGRFGEKGHAEYSAAKAGLHGLVRTLKNEIVELDRYARVNMIEPGWTVTHMARPALEEPGVISKVVRTMPLRQLGRAVDIARTALYLSSHAAARHVSGEVITVAGGMEGRSLWEAKDVDEAAIRKRLDRE
jgi:3-oxoacyl-[acyl-carrier protein] reductase